MAIVAMVLLGILIFLLTGSKGLFVRRAVLYTYLDDSAALTEGSAVRLNGILVGKVRAIELTNSRDPRRLVRMTMEIDERRLSSIPSDSVAALGAESVLGTKYLNIKTGQSRVPVRPGGELPSLDTREFTEVVQSGYATLTALQGILKRIDAIVSVVEAGEGSIGKLLLDEELYNRMLTVVNDVQKVSAALATERGTLGRLIYDDALYQEIRSPIARLDDLLQEMQAGRGTAGKFLKDPALYDDLRQTVAEARRLVDGLNAGQGTAGKLLKSDELHKQMSGVVTRLDGILERLTAGEGTLGQLLVNPQLYESLTGFTGDAQALVKDFRANPKKFLRIKLSLF